jgi:hypothetical protein
VSAQRRVLREDNRVLGKPGPGPVSFALAERHKAEAWRLLCVACLLLSLVLTYLCVRAARVPERVFVLDAAGNILAGPSEPMAESRGFFNLSALHSTHVMLQRSSEGFDLYEMLRLYFAPRAVQKMEESWLSQKADAKARNLQQKPLVERITEPVKAGAARVVEVRGRLMRAGAVAGRSFYEELPFILVLSYERNPDLGKAGAYPWLCQDFELTLKEALE